MPGKRGAGGLEQGAKRSHTLLGYFGGKQQPTWRMQDSVLCIEHQQQEWPTGAGVAAFDLDGTIIKTKSGRTFAKDASDWVFWTEKATIVDRMQQCVAKGQQIVILSNQNGIGIGKTTPETVFSKLESILQHFPFPVLFLAATCKDRFRKPATGMWDTFLQPRGVDASASIYIGDAAGRKTDFAASDRTFALNLGIPFKTPEEFFLDHTPAPFSIGFDPRTALSDPASGPPAEQWGPQTCTELVVLVGLPASGKSTMAKALGEGYLRINRDSKSGSPRAAKEALKSGTSVIIDNTNGTVKARAQWIQIASDTNVPCRCVWIARSRSMAEHLNKVRSLLSGDKAVPAVAYNTYSKRFEEPQCSEGFARVDQVVPAFTFASLDEKRLFLKFS